MNDPRATDMLHVETTGVGPPLVLLHGFALHAGLFAPLIPVLARRHCVHAVDLPGHGHSSASVPCTLDRMVDAIAGHFRAERAPLTVLGWSLGGAVAMRWAIRDPARIGRLVLVGTTPRFVTAHDWPHAMAPVTLARFGDELNVAYRLTLQRFLSLQVQGSEDGRKTLAALRARLFERGEPSRAAIAEVLAMLATIDLRVGVEGIRARTLVLSGDRDTLTPPAAGKWLADTITGAEYASIGGAAHAPFLSHPSEFEGILAPFFEGAAGGR